MPKNPISHLAFVAGLAFLATTAALAQVEPDAEGGPTPPDDLQMLTPPPVSYLLYPTVTGAEARTNYLASSMVVDIAHLSNVLPGLDAPLVKDTTYSFLPSLVLDRTTPRQQLAATYNPTFTFYEPTTTLDAFDQSASIVYQNRPSPYTTVIVQDFFSRTADVFNVSFPFSDGGIAGVPQAPAPAAIAPFVEQLKNTASANIADQFGRNAMAGVGGTYSIFSFPNPAQAEGLANSHGGDASAFYDRRFSHMRYAGVSYDYNRILAGPDNALIDTRVHSVFPFYSWYVSRTFSFSLSGGMQRVSVAQLQLPTQNSWSPAGVVSMGWQSSRVTISASYLHTITAGGGLVGAYSANSVSGAGAWVFARTWAAHANASYSTISVAVPLAGLPYQAGDTIGASGSIAHDLSERFTVEGGYERLHENFGGITVISHNPDSDRIFLTASYRFERLLGR
jgi:hypothetical protein